MLILLSLSISFAFGCVGTFFALRVGTGEAMQSLFPIFFVFLFFSSMALPRDLIEQDWFRHDRRHQPDLLPDRGDPQPLHHRLRRRGARRSRSGSAALLAAVFLSAAVGQPPDQAGADVSAPATGSPASGRSPLAVAWRSLHNFLTNPALLIPALLFPLFFFTAFAGGLSRIDQAPGLRLPERLHGLRVRLRDPAGVGLRRRLHRLRDRPRLRDRLRPPADARRAEPARRSSPATRSRRWSGR